MPDEPREDGRKVNPRALVALLLLGYGLLVLVGVLPHDSAWAGLASLVAGAFLLIPGLPNVSLRRARWVPAVGTATVAGVLLYNLANRSGLGAPELGILAYGCLLVVAYPFFDRRIGRTDVGTLVAWSFPVLFAPLAVFALNASLSSAATGTAAAPLVHAVVVAPAAAALRMLGNPVRLIGNNMVLPTADGTITLDVGLVCAGLYPMVLFLGLCALHAWQTRASWRRLGVLLAVGFLGLWILNIGRLLLLAKVGQRWGAEALEATHANIGWILFALYMGLFWAAVRRFSTDHGDTPGRESAGAPTTP